MKVYGEVFKDELAAKGHLQFAPINQLGKIKVNRKVLATIDNTGGPNSRIQIDLDNFGPVVIDKGTCQETHHDRRLVLGQRVVGDELQDMAFIFKKRSIPAAFFDFVLRKPGAVEVEPLEINKPLA